MPPRTGDLIRNFVSGDNTHIIASDQLGQGAHAHCEGFPFPEILDGLVAFAQIHSNLLIIRDSTPSGIHSRGNIILAVSGDDQHRLGICVGLRPEILSCHSVIIYRSLITSLEMLI